ncbi:glycosyltransferase family 2 protein [Salsipaludibacter albus]|uniref:glycosyltransferase family 2 protein n=1 Tax=Salsipaludibacter albus TaxID=2849650 RepID=UPI001EE48ED1|nr:glycosyltransferase family 2 protein [Salsipaludibacter albus]MBY5162522.1 glycosyltransferase family 2 protein [Salsipaludibacter albus]
MDTWPDLSVVMPAVDEALHLPAALAAVTAQDYPGRLEVVVAVGPSTDHTRRVARQVCDDDPRVRVVDNVDGSTPAGLNRAIEASTGAVVARVDAHAELAPGYLRRAVELLHETGAGNVGGVQRAVGAEPFQRAVAAAMGSKFGTGDARFHYGGPPGPVDTVYLGVFRREALAEVGGFDESLLRNQDYELNIRLRRAGWEVWFHPDLEVVYRPRRTVAALAEQYFQYGRWKRLVADRDRASLRWRQVVPPVAVAANLAGLAVGIRRPRALAVPLAYLGATLAASAIEAVRQDLPREVALRLPVAFATMHHAWGLGFLRGGADSGSASTGDATTSSGTVPVTAGR